MQKTGSLVTGLATGVSNDCKSSRSSYWICSSTHCSKLNARQSCILGNGPYSLLITHTSAPYGGNSSGTQGRKVRVFMQLSKHVTNTINGGRVSSREYREKHQRISENYLQKSTNGSFLGGFMKGFLLHSMGGTSPRLQYGLPTRLVPIMLAQF